MSHSIPSSMLPQPLDLASVMDQCVHIVQDSGAIAMKYFAQQHISSHQKSSDDIKTHGSPVSIADKEIEAFLSTKLTELLPGSHVYGEESGETQGSSDNEYTWILDPIDGTRLFLRGMDEWAIIVALKYQDQIVLGCSYMPAIDEMLYAYAGGGARLNGARVHVSQKSLAESFVFHEREKYFVRDGSADALHKVCTYADYSRAENVRSFHYLATGSSDAHISPVQQVYDIAPFLVIIPEAGGRVTQLDGKEIDISTLASTTALFSNGVCHDEIVEYFR